jgi:hypothetical protein
MFNLSAINAVQMNFLAYCIICFLFAFLFKTVPVLKTVVNVTVLEL